MATHIILIWAMNRRQIVYFRAVASAGSISRAAASLRIAQPALSARIAELELDLGVKLFTRTPRGVELTEHGKVLLPHADTIESAFVAAVDALRKPIGGQPQIISIGVTPAIAPSLLPNILDVASVDSRAVEWRAQQAAAHHLVEMLLDGSIDVALMYYDPNRAGLTAEPLQTENMGLIGSPSVLGTEDNIIQLVDAARFELVLDQKSHLSRQVIEATAARKKIKLNVVAEVEPLAAKERLLKRGYCTIMPRGAFFDQINSGTLVCKEITAPKIDITLFIVFTGAANDRSRFTTAAIKMGLKI